MRDTRYIFVCFTKTPEAVNITQIAHCVTDREAKELYEFNKIRCVNSEYVCYYDKIMKTGKLYSFQEGSSMIDGSSIVGSF